MQTLRFPQDLLRFLYWVFFKPFTLVRYFQQADPTLKSNLRILTLWHHSKKNTKLRSLFWLVLFHLFLTPCLGIFFALLASMIGLNVNWNRVVGGILGGMTFGLAGSAVYTVLYGVAFSSLAGTFGSLIYGLTDNATYSLVVGIGFGVAASMMYSVEFGQKGGWVISFLVSLFVGIVSGLVGDINLGIFSGICFYISYLRIPIYLIEVPFAWGLSRIEGNSIRLWRLSPVNWDEVIWFPLPGLERHLMSMRRQEPFSGLDAILQVSGSLGQGWAAERAILRLIGEDLQGTTTLAGMAAISEKMVWLPDKQRSQFKSLLLGIEEISRYARAALEGETLYNRQEQLRQALGLTERMRTGLALAGGARLAAQWGPGLEGWERVFQEALKALDSREVIPNVYVGGSPLAATSKVFKGRADLFRALEAELATAAEVRPALLLFGARRTGKTSVIKQLPNRLGPQIVPVEVDLQSAATAESAVGLLKRVSEVIYKACEARHFEVAAVPAESLEKDPYPVFQDWLEKVESALGERWLLLAMDEYEALGGMLEQGRVDERVFQLLRGLVQHHRLVILFSGAHTLEDLPPLWSNYLVNVKVLKVNALKESEARELVTKPIPAFNLEYEAEAVEMILRATACQPYLIQVVCRELVNALNEESRLCARVEDVQHALDCALTSATAYFNDLFKGNDSDDEQRAMMTALAGAKDGAMSTEQLQRQTKLAEDRLQKALRRLTHREVLQASEGVYRFRVEMVRLWVREKGN